MDILIKVLQFFMSLTLLVAVHEFGHFIVARLFKIRVEKFYIFFDWGFSFWKKKFGDTEYGIGWLPLGGYCKIAGMVDESMDKEQIASEPQPWEFRAKPAWQRFLVLVAGVTMNVVLAFFIYCGVRYVYGRQYVTNESMVYGYEFSPSAERLGFQDGDHIVSIGGEQILDRAAIIPKIILAKKNCEVVVKRNGVEHQFVINNDTLNAIRKQKSYKDELLCVPLVTFEIDSVVSQSAIAAGLKKGDRVVGVNGVSTPFYNYMIDDIRNAKGSAVNLQVLRGADTLSMSVPVDENGLLGVNRAIFGKQEVETYTLLEAIPAGARLTGESIKDYWDQLVLIFQPKTGLYQEVGGFVAIGSLFPAEWDWLRFWSMTALLSIILAVMNIIPIPGLDGGHMIFTLWEMITRRKVSEKVLEVAQYIGMGLILLLVLYANGNDIYKLFVN